jgi:hypothetical protein
MATGPRYFLSENGQRTGPHSLAVLKQKAELGVLKPDTSIAPETEPDEWTPISDSQVLCEELFPLRRQFTFGARPIEKVNTPTAPHHAPSVDEMLRDNLARQRSTEGELLKPMPPRSNRRLTDYLFTVAAGAGLSMLPWLFVPVTAAHVFLAVGATVFVAISAAWVFFFVMDRY